MKPKAQLKICNEVIYPGESVSLALPLPELYSCLPAYMPIKVINGKKPGPCLLVFAAINGDEVNGTAIINKLLINKKLKDLHGSLIAIPVVNVFGMANKSKFLPGNISLSENFPGSKTGTHAERIAHLFIQEIFELADYSISLETGPLNHSYLPEITTNFKLPEMKNLAKVFNAPVITHAEGHPKSLIAYAQKHHKKLLTYTAGESFRFDSKAISVGAKGLINLMSHLKMISEPEAKTKKSHAPLFLDSTMWVRTSFSGIATSKIKLGMQVRKNTELCMINDPFGTKSSHKIISPKDGVIIGINNVPLVKEGEALFKLASFEGHFDQGDQLKKWDEHL